MKQKSFVSENRKKNSLYVMYAHCLHYTVFVVVSKVKLMLLHIIWDVIYANFIILNCSFNPFYCNFMSSE